MMPETEVQVVLALDNMITKLDRVLDELEDIETHKVSEAEHIIMTISTELHGLIDRITADSVEAGHKSGAV